MRFDGAASGAGELVMKGESSVFNVVGSKPDFEVVMYLWSQTCSCVG